MFSRDFAPSRTAPRAPHAHVGVFGKHPAWPDFMDDLGLNTHALVEFRQVLFVDGIRRLIDSGRWERHATGETPTPAPAAAEAAAAIDFKHDILSISGGSTLFGKLWASTDAKGRARYPLVIVADVGAADPEWAIERLPPHLSTLEQQVRAAASPDLVQSAVLRAQADLAREVAGTRAIAPPTSLDNAVRELSNAQELGPSYLRLQRIMYHLDRELSDYRRQAPPKSRLLSATSGGSGSIGTGRARHLRLPTLGGPVRDSSKSPFAPWLRLLRAWLDPGTSLLMLAPDRTVSTSSGSAWIDVIVGTPSDSELFCIRAGAAAVPFTTEIPYTLDAQFVSGVQRMVSAAQ